ncbi:MAG: YmdB family metallophosphoesterase, partial [Phycisphaerae bacterium]|nr:YmdB family metallophosphoesterase [Phycisphaerae bacterium]
ATSDKIAMGWHLDGRVTAVSGTHTHVQTSDARILPEGTAYITDLGMTGPHDSILGRDKHAVLSAMMSRMPERFTVATDDCRLHGVLVTADADTGRATAIEAVNVSLD